MKKAVLIILLIASSALASAQTDTATKFIVKKTVTTEKRTAVDIRWERCVFILDGVSFCPGGQIRKEMLLKLCDLQIMDTTSRQIVSPVSFRWVIARGGEMFHNQKPEGCRFVSQLVARVQIGDMIFIDEIECRETATLKGQFYFRII